MTTKIKETVFTTLLETKKGDRKKMAQGVIELCEKHGIHYSYEQKFLGCPRSCAVHIRCPEGLQLTVDFDGDSHQPNVYVLSWYVHHAAPRNLRIAPGFCFDINSYHHRKATDVCYGWERLCETLDKRLGDAAAGKAMCDNKEVKARPQNQTRN